jgi:hypothetical protein
MCRLLESDLKPRDIISRAAFDKRVAVIMTSLGSPAR